MPESIDSARGYRPDIDGLRAVAIVLVIAYHYFGLTGGYIGVDVFFVISGYLITGILLSDLRGRRLSLRDFYARRFRRILPPLLAVLGTTLFVGWVCLRPFDLRELSQEARASAVYLANFLFWQESGYFDVAATTKPLLHLWSLGVEEQFYLLWPALLLLANWCRRRTDLGIVAILVASFLANLVLIQNDPAGAFYSPLSRLWELAAGGLLVELEWRCHGPIIEVRRLIIKPEALRTLLSSVGLLLILGAAILYSNELSFPGYFALIPVVGSALVVAAGTESWLNRSILACGPMTRIGKCSYSLYLWHWPVLVLAGLVLGDLHIKYLREACLATSVLLAWGTYCWLEAPIRRIPVRKGNAWRFLTVGIGASAAFASVGFLILSGTLARAADARLITKHYFMPEIGCTFTGPAPRPNTAVFAPCERIRYPGHPTVVLAGDSHAKALYPNLKAYLDARQVNLIEYTATGCGPFLLHGAKVHSSCAATYEYILTQISERRPNLIVLFAHYLRYEDALSAGYGQFIVQRMAQLQHTGSVNVLVVGQMPIWTERLPFILNDRYLRFGQPAPTRMFTGLQPESLSIDDRMQTASKELSLPYYSLKDQLCNVQGCLTRVGDSLPENLIVFDDGHMTASGARYLLSTGLGQRIDSLLAGQKRSPAP